MNFQTLNELSEVLSYQLRNSEVITCLYLALWAWGIWTIAQRIMRFLKVRTSVISFAFAPPRLETPDKIKEWILMAIVVIDIFISNVDYDLAIAAIPLELRLAIYASGIFMFIPKWEEKFLKHRIDFFLLLMLGIFTLFAFG